MNLLTNASEALREEIGTVRVSTGTVEADRAYLKEGLFGDEPPEGRFVYSEVTDTGPGMELETRQRIFAPFFFVQFTGPGLGFAAILGIAKGHGGTIKVSSEPRRGSAFKVLLPAFDADLHPMESKSEVPRAHLGGATILLVDDDAGVLEVSGAMLDHAGF